MSGVDAVRYPVIQAFGSNIPKLTTEQAIAATREERIASVWYFVVDKVTSFHKTLKPRERANADVEDILLDLWTVIAEKDPLWNPEIATYITFIGMLVAHELEELRGRARTIQSPRNATSRLRDYTEAEEAGSLTSKSAQTAAALRRTLGEPEPLDNQGDKAVESPDDLAARADIERFKHGAIRKCLSKMPAEHAAIVVRIIGINGRPPQTTEQIARDLGMSHGCVSEIREKSFKKLKRLLCLDPDIAEDDE